MYDLVDHHVRKLDQEFAKFGMELEAENAGITEILKRQLEVDTMCTIQILLNHWDYITWAHYLKDLGSTRLPWQCKSQCKRRREEEHLV